MRLFDLGHIRSARFKKYCSRENQNGCIHKKSKVQRDRAINKIQFEGFFYPRIIPFDLSGLHQGRMQVKIMRHNGGADDPDRDVEHAPGW
jgi:hypothetical protein